jgi:hypothetical protein
MAPRRSWAKANNPFWSKHVVAWYQGALETEHYCRKHDLSTTSLMRWARHLLSAEDLRKRAQHQRNLPQKASKWQKREPSKRQRRPRRYRYGVRTDNGPIALRAFWSMRVEAMNFIEMGHAEHAAALVCHRIRCAFDAIAWNNPATKWTGVPCFIGVPGRD